MPELKKLKNGRLNINRGSYVICGCIDVDGDQKEWLRLMTGRVLSSWALSDFLADGQLDGAVVQHRRSGRMYLVQSGQLVVDREENG